MERSDTESLIGGLQVRIYGSGPPILLIHGFGASSFTWSEIITPLASHYKVVTLDLKGFGGSEKPEDGRYSFQEQKRKVLLLINELTLDEITLVGHSMGGGIALLVAMDLEREAPGRLRRLVLIDSISCPQPLPFFIVLLRTPLIGPLVLRLVPATWSVYAILWLAYFKPSKIKREFVQAYAAPLRHPAGRAAVVATARELIPPNLDDLVAQYRMIRVPVLILWGDKDRIVPLSVSECLRKAIPTACFILIGKCGHVPQEEWPDRTASELREFIAKTEQVPAPPR